MERTSKRDFLKLLLGGGGLAWLAAVVYPILAYLKPPVQGEVEVTSVKVGPLSGIEKNSGTIMRFGTKPVLLIRTATGELRALSATCTHLDCTVQYRPDLQHIWCACHDGHYDLNGVNIAGPPPRPLERFEVVVKADNIVVSRKT